MLNANVVKELKDTVNSLGYDLAHIEWKAGRGKGVLRLFIENESGISLDDCQKVSREVSVLMDVLDPISHPYNLEISSPGVQRPIFKQEEYVRFIGKNISVKLATSMGNKMNLKGTLCGCGGENITLSLGKETLTIPLNNICESRLLGPWEEVD